jgi:hypothetical protein
MSSFAEDLRRSLVADLGYGGENPLVTIGLTPQILELGLTNEELHDICKGFARSLFVKFHEDRGDTTPRARELQDRFSSAFSVIKDEEQFVFALQAFRRMHSEVRSEQNHVARERDTHRDLQTDLLERLAKADQVAKDMRREMAHERSEWKLAEKKLRKKSYTSETERRLLGRRIGEYFTETALADDVRGREKGHLEFPSASGITVLHVRVNHADTIRWENKPSKHPQHAKALAIVRALVGESNEWIRTEVMSLPIQEGTITYESESSRYQIIGSFSPRRIKPQIMPETIFRIEYEDLIPMLRPELIPGYLLAVVPFYRRRLGRRDRPFSMPRIANVILDVEKK